MRFLMFRTRKSKVQGVGWFRPQLRNRSESSPELRDLAKPLLIYLAESVFELRSHSPDETVFEPHLQSLGSPSYNQHNQESHSGLPHRQTSFVPHGLRYAPSKAHEKL